MSYLLLAAASCLLLTSALASGCGGGALSCSVSSMGAAITCTEVDNPPAGAASQERADCTMNGGQNADGPCSHANAVGGCLLTFHGASFSVTTWIYKSASFKTAADVMKLCQQQGSIFVSP